MPSNIDPTKPLDGVPAVKSELRDNLLAIQTSLEGAITLNDGDLAGNVLDLTKLGHGNQVIILLSGAWTITSSELEATRGQVVNKSSLAATLFTDYVLGAGESAAYIVHNGSAHVIGAYGPDQTRFDVSHFNVLPTNTAADNSVGLISLRDLIQARQSNGRHYTIHIPPGSYDYDDNAWLFGIKNFTVDGYGATVRNTNAVADTHAQHALKFNEFFSAILPSPTNATKTGTFLIDTMNGDDDVATLKNTADISNFAVGMKVIIFSLSTQDTGYPPNVDQIEFGEITAIDAGLGQITLREGVHYTHRDDWVSASGGSGVIDWGAASIHPATTPFFDWPHSMNFHGLTIQQNPNHPNTDSGGQIPTHGEFVIFKDCHLYPNTVPAFSRLHRFENTYLRNLVIDKLNVDVEVIDCDLYNLRDSYGARSFYMRGGFLGQSNNNERPNLASRQVIVENVTFSSGTIPANNTLTRDSRGFRPQTAITWRNVDIINRSATATAVFDRGRFEEFTIDALDGSDNLVLAKNNTNYVLLHRALGLDSMVFKLDGTNFGKLVNITETATDYVAEFEWQQTPTVAETWAGHTGPKTFNIEGIRLRGPQIPTWENYFALSEYETSAEVELELLAWPPTKTYNAYTFIEAIEVFIGPSANTAGDVLNIRLPTSALTTQVIDLSTPGHRVISLGAPVNSLGTDVLNANILGQWTEDIQFTASAGAVKPPGWIRFKLYRPKL